MGSALLQFAHVQETLQSVGMVDVNTHLGAFGQNTVKPCALFLNHPSSEFRDRLARPKSFAQMRVSATGPPKALTDVMPRSKASMRKGTVWRLGGWTTGNKKRMFSSSEYRHEFADVVARLVLHVAGPS